MKEQPNDLWRGGPWEQPSPSFPTPPPVVVPARRPPVLRVRRRRRTLLPFLALFLLVVGLSLGTVAVRWLLPWDDEPLTPHLSEQEERDPFAALERAETGTGVQVQISQREGEVMDAVEIYEKCVPSVVSIQADGEGEYSTGTGVVMSADGYILTNAHVVADSLRMSVLLSDGRVMEARLVGADAGEDLAVLKVEASGLTPAEFGDSDRLRCGEMVVAIGDPLGYRTSITQGIVSALNRTVPVDGVELQVIQTSAPINFGNSGGALINDRGQVVGITTLKVVAQDSTVEGLTNAHVVADSLRMSVLLSDGRVMEARLVGADAGEDLAVLKVEASGLTPAEFGDSDRLRCGEMVVAIGDPLGYRTSITQGIVSALNRTVPVDGVELQVIQTSAPINFGNSGGALINDRGQVVGITTLKVVAQDSTVEGLGFAIPMQKVKEVADWLIAGQPAMGFTVDFSGGSLRVAALEENSSAGRAGLQVDDVLLSLNGAPLPTIQELRRVKNTLIPGETATLMVRRGGEERNITFSVQCEADFPDRTA